MKPTLLITCALLVVANQLAGASVLAAAKPFEDDSSSATVCGEMDQVVFTRLEQLKIQPANLCSDAVFVRRVYLDVIGAIPTASEARDFLLSREQNKRAALIDRLLAREEFADYWAMKWGDILRVKAEFPINLWPNAVQAYHHWIRASIKENLPYDQFARELFTESGSNFRVPQVNFYRAMQNREPQGIAQTVALTFMGTRAEKWPKERLSGMVAIFSQVGYKPTAEWKEEIVYFDPSKATNCGAPVFPDGTAARLPRDRDPREVFAEWLIDKKNPWFARNIVNRVWSWLLGRGIVHEPDDIREDNPPSNPELLTFLEKELIRSHYDLKHVYRLILNSRIYQLSSIPKVSSPEAEANFAYHPLRQLEAEVLIDALNQITGTTEKYSSPIPEPFTFIPDKQRTIAIADGSITSPFLEMFGRPPRDTGLESERNNRPSAAQKLHLLNSSHILNKIQQSRMIEYLTTSKKPPNEIASGMYLGILSRFPTTEEFRIIQTHFESAANQREAAVDLTWALINSAEFLYRH